MRESPIARRALLLAALLVAATGVNAAKVVLTTGLGADEESASLKAKGSALFAAAAKGRRIELAPEAASPSGFAEGDLIILGLIAGGTCTVTVDRVSTNTRGVATVRGRFSDSTLGYFLLSTVEGKSLGTIRIPERAVQSVIVYEPAEGAHYLLDIDPVALDVLEGGPPLRPPVQAEEGTSLYSRTPDPVIAADVNDPAMIDVMIVYTPAARQWGNSNGGIDNIIAQAMASAQLAFDNSGTLITARLVYSAEVSYTESGSSNTDLNRLQGSGDGYMDSVHGLRDTYGADLVVLLSLVDDTGGLGYLLSNTGGSPAYGFSITRVQQAGWSLTTVHEIGHNMGCHHHKLQNTQPGPGLFTYAAGWRWTENDANRYCSVMTYESGSYFSDGYTHTRIPYFSNPAVYQAGMPTGHATEGDNARTLRETKHVVAAYRTLAANTVATPQYTPMSGTTFGSSLSVTLTCDTSGATLRYTTNGSDPTASSTLYAGPLALNTTTTLKARGFKSGLTDSAIATAVFTKTSASDAFAQAIAISGLNGTVSGSSVGATKEAGEPNHYSSGGASVWWKWTAPATGNVTFDTVGSSFDTLLATYRGGSVSTLTKLAEDDDSGGSFASRLTFTATNGLVYAIAVDGHNGATGAIILNWVQTVPVPSAPTGLTAANGASVANVALSWSAVAGATAYEVWRHTTSVSNSASKIADPASASHSDTTATPGVLYYYWVKAKNAAGTSPFSVSASGYRALSVPGSVSATDGDPAKIRVTWSAVAGASHYRVSRATSVGGTKSDLGSWQSGTTYDDTSVPTGVTYYYWVRAAVDSSGTRASTYSALDSGFRPSAGPPNDAFAAAIALTGAAGQASGDNRGGTMQAGEPSHNSDAAATASVWWSWTAPVAGQAVFDTAGSSFDTVLAVYTGTSLGALTAVASNDDALGTASRAAFNAVGGVVYRVAVAGYGGASGDVVLNWVLFAPDGPTIVGSEFITLSGQSYLRVRFKGKAGKTYAAQRAAVLAAPPQWQALSPPATKAATADGIQTLDVPLSGGMTSGFFRIVQQ